MSAHARLSPSGSSRWLNCPHSAQDNLPDEDTAATRSGSRYHHWAEKVLTGEAKIEKVPKTYRSAVKMYVDYIVKLGVPVTAERKFYSLELPDLFGTIDCLAIDGRTGWIIDFKSGEWAVEAKDNTQLLTYAMIVDDWFSVDEWRAVIIQPRARHGPKTKGWVIDRETLDIHKEMVRKAAVSAEKKAGDWCRGCPLRKHLKCQEGVELGQRMGWGYGKW